MGDDIAAIRKIRVGQEVLLWIGPITAYLMLTEACQILNPHTFGEVLRLSAIAFLLSIALSILAAAAWTILVMSWNQPCEKLLNGLKLNAVADWPRIDGGCGHRRGHLAGQIADSPRLFRGRENLVLTRSKACLVQNR